MGLTLLYITITLYVMLLDVINRFTWTKKTLPYLFHPQPLLSFYNSFLFRTAFLTDSFGLVVSSSNPIRRERHEDGRFRNLIIVLTIVVAGLGPS